ncbi:MAG: methylmalonyl-CoA mutase [Chloroflexi bacterium CG_4_9_14_3_um_filter_45_9]|nr:MAG: methylmalonyl-CoA mutase [Chloroflexi bacterium CG08_land_8_20_14_0_20_45_12]PJB51218.1 MAG: methylmalonyl-CoA mutase [Chloroflexi bacterium CG_4_9_14_3_um_filter_45_9]
MEGLLQEGYREWLKGTKSQEQRFSASQIPLNPLYTPLDLEDKGFDYLADLGLPGEYPYTRGIRPLMYRERLWTMRQYSGHGTREETNQIFKKMIEMGATGLSLAFDLPTQLGYDSDDSRTFGEVGVAGVAVDSVEDMKVIYDGIDLSKVTASMTINAPTAPVLAMYLVAAEERGYKWESLGGTVQNDILKEYLSRGNYIYPPRPSLRLTSDVIEFCAKHIPRWNTISVCGYHMRDAGATPVQEIAWMLLDAIEYVTNTVKRGINVDEFAFRITWLPSVNHIKFFEEIAKIRAARKIWANIMKERFGAKDPKSWCFRIYTRANGWHQTNHNIVVNVAKNALSSLAAVLAGAQAIDCCTMDEALGIPSDEAEKVALRTLQVIAHETGVTDVVDPLGGSYYIEWLTKELEERILEEMRRVESEGGIVKAIEKGNLQAMMARNSHEYYKKLDRKEELIVGLNIYTDEEMEEPERNLYFPDPMEQEKQTKKLAELREKRDNRKVKTTLERLKEATMREEESDSNLMYPVVEAVRARATLQEICDTLREVFGEYISPPGL